MIIHSYFREVVSLLEKIDKTQAEAMDKAAELICDTISQGGMIYIFGCGHSHLIALDCFYRAGGLANVCPMLDTDLMLHNGAAKSSKMEKMQNLAAPIFERYCLCSKDTLIVVSTSGKNAVPVEMAKEAIKNKIKTIAVASSQYYNDVKDKAMLLQSNADVYIDNCVPHGDAAIDLEGLPAKMGSLSTAASSFVLQSVLLSAAEKSIKTGCVPDVYFSGNVAGGSEYNKKIVDKYYTKIKHL